MSPSVWWGNGMIVNQVRSLKAKPSTRIWLDIGSREGRLTPAMVRKLKNTLITAGWRMTDDLHFLEIENGSHCEEEWGKRAGQALEYLFPAKKTTGKSGLSL